FFEQFESSPSMRQLVRFLKIDNADIASSVALLKLFPGSPAKIAAKVAGLPKPENCL
ncbi:MAG: TusE/DsrC/DsvC family sulfur relay protein, partial [Gammaproteobacteria bacterium]|nr:TusE/DsrC/DsvC family sulfur relay protein [Gammaproteobacteria bacterium]